MALVPSAVYPRRGSIAAAPSIATLKTFGAAGDGVTDDTAAFTRALVGGAGTVLLTQGTYVVSPAAVYNIFVNVYGTVCLRALTDSVVIKTAGFFVGVDPAVVGVIAGPWFNGWPAALSSAVQTGPSLSATFAPRLVVEGITFLNAPLAPPWLGSSTPLLDVVSTNTAGGLVDTGVVHGCRFFGPKGLRCNGSRLLVTHCQSWCTYAGFTFPSGVESVMANCATYQNAVGVSVGGTATPGTYNVEGFRLLDHYSIYDAVGVQLVGVNIAVLQNSSLDYDNLPLDVQNSNGVVVENCYLGAAMRTPATPNFPPIPTWTIDTPAALLAAWPQSATSITGAALSFSAGTGFVTYVGPLMSAWENCRLDISGTGLTGYDGGYNVLQFALTKTLLLSNGTTDLTMVLQPVTGQAPGVGGTAGATSYVPWAAGAPALFHNTPSLVGPIIANCALRNCTLYKYTGGTGSVIGSAATGTPYVLAMAAGAGNDTLSNFDVTGCTGTSGAVVGCQYAGAWVVGGQTANTATRIQNNNWVIFPTQVSPVSPQPAHTNGTTVGAFAPLAASTLPHVPVASAALATTANADAAVLQP